MFVQFVQFVVFCSAHSSLPQHTHHGDFACFYTDCVPCRRPDSGGCVFAPPCDAREDPGDLWDSLHGWKQSVFGSAVASGLYFGPLFFCSVPCSSPSSRVWPAHRLLHPPPLLGIPHLRRGWLCSRPGHKTRLWVCWLSQLID